LNEIGGKRRSVRSHGLNCRRRGAARLWSPAAEPGRHSREKQTKPQEAETSISRRRLLATALPLSTAGILASTALAAEQPLEPIVS